jgi:hypothetical protein
MRNGKKEHGWATFGVRWPIPMGIDGRKKEIN